MRMGISLLLFICMLACAGCSKTKTTDELIEDLKSPEERERIVAIRTLKGDAAKVVPALIDALKDKQSEVRLNAAIKLGFFGEKAKDAIPALEVAQSDRDIRVREAAGVALSRIDPVTSRKR
jgi:HEAT repeat protein